MFDSLNEDCSSEYIGFAIAAVITILRGSFFKVLENYRGDWIRESDCKSEPRTVGYK